MYPIKFGWCIITDSSVLIKTKEEWIVQFDGVESFYVDKFNGRTFIGIRYKDNTEEAITDDEISQNRKLRLKTALQGYPYVYFQARTIEGQDVKPHHCAFEYMRTKSFYKPLIFYVW